MSIKTILRKGLSKLGIGKVRRAAEGMSARYYLKKIGKKTVDADVIKVAFLVYEPAMWDKQEPVYIELKSRENVQVYLIATPEGDAVDQEATARKIDFFCRKYQNVLTYDDSILERFASGEFHYTFYQTPYIAKYPAEIRPAKLVKYTKICYVPYAYVGSSDFFETSSKTNFFENVYFAFMDNAAMLQVVQDKFPRTSKNGTQHFELLGYPPFEYYTNMPAPKEKIENVLWIPRWSYAEKGGGSHFLEHKDLFNALAKEEPQMNWAVRPHPLMFPSMARLGLFSCEQAAAYRQQLQEAGVRLDENSLVNEALEQTDLLLADYSSIIIMYFLSGRPIVYFDCGIEMNGIYAEMREGMYIAKTWEEAKAYINDLKNGIDPLKEKRLEIAGREAALHQDASKKIVDRIIQDFGW